MNAAYGKTVRAVWAADGGQRITRAERHDFLSIERGESTRFLVCVLRVWIGRFGSIYSFESPLKTSSLRVFSEAV